jgi:hypothetical protein
LRNKNRLSPSLKPSFLPKKEGFLFYCRVRPEPPWVQGCPLLYVGQGGIWNEELKNLAGLAYGV